MGAASIGTRSIERGSISPLLAGAFGRLAPMSQDNLRQKDRDEMGNSPIRSTGILPLRYSPCDVVRPVSDCEERDVRRLGCRKNVPFPASCVPEHNHGILEGISNPEFSSWKFRELVRSAGLRVSRCQRAHHTVLRQSDAPSAGNDFFRPPFCPLLYRRIRAVGTPLNSFLLNRDSTVCHASVS